MILNIKTLVMKIQDDEIYTLRISKQGPGAVSYTHLDVYKRQELSNTEIAQQIETLKDELFNLRFQQATGQLTNLSLIHILVNNIQMNL